MVDKNHGFGNMSIGNNKWDRFKDKNVRVVVGGQNYIGKVSEVNCRNNAVYLNPYLELGGLGYVYKVERDLMIPFEGSVPRGAKKPLMNLQKK